MNKLIATQCDQFIISDSSVFDISVNPGTNTDKIYINGVALGDKTSIISEQQVLDYFGNTNYIAYIHFNDKVDVSLNITSNGSTETVTHSLGDDINKGYDTCQKMLDHETSFQLLRANPKLTGNIKVVVDSDNNLYLDTFKVSKGLSQRKYRKVKINPNEYYGMSVMSQLKDLPSDDLYRIEDSCYSLFSSINNVGDSYYDVYNSGVRTNKDNLYKESFSLLAPLCIRKNTPDFFLIFKCKNIPEFTSDKDRISYMITYGELVKSFDLRKNSNIGKYINKIYNKSKNYPGYIFVSYNYDEYNVYNGISVDRGVLAPHYESTSTERTIKNQVAMNDWYTLGFERNRIIAKDIVNFEFMFDDYNEDVFSVSNYFGFYVRLNGEDKEFSCIQSSETFDEASYTFDAQLKGISFKPENNMNVIYGFSEPHGFHRLNHNIYKKVNNSPINDYVMKPYKNILSSEVAQYDKSTSYVKFVMEDDFEAGEHYRIIDTIDCIIYDVIVSNYESSYDYSEISYDYFDNYEIRKVSIYNAGFRNSQQNNSKLKQQIKNITDAFNKMNPDKIKAESNGTNSITLTYKGLCDYKDTPTIIFQRILSGCVSDDISISDIKQINDKSCKILNQYQQPFVIDDGNDSIFNTHGFEALGKRLSYATSFVPTIYDNNELCVVKDAIDDVINNYHSIIYKTSHTNKQTNEDIYNYTTSTDKNNFIKTYAYDDNGDLRWTTINVTSITGPGKNDTYARFFPQDEMYPDISDGILRLYQNYPLNVGICSIFPVKDLDTTVYDSISTISFNPIDGNVSDVSGRYNKRDNIFGETKLEGEEEYLCDYIDKYERFKTSSTISLDRNNQTLKDYIETLSNNNVTKSDVSLIVPYCCKWESIGTDSTGERMRIMYPLKESNYTYMNDAISYYIPLNDDRGIGFVSSSNTNAVNYSNKHINDGFSTKNHHNFREYITHGKGSLDDIVYIPTNKKHSTSRDIKNKWSTIYKHGNNSIEFISGGAKIRLSSSNDAIINLTKYNGYSGILICMDGNNPLRDNNLEVFIDETKSQLALIYYNGTSSKDALICSSIGIFDQDPSTYTVYHLPLNDSLSKAEISHNGTKMQVSVADNGGISDSFCKEGKLFFSSPVVNYDAYTQEKYNLIIADVDNDTMLKDIYAENRIAGNNPVIFSDSSIIQNTNANINTHLEKHNQTTDAFLVTPRAKIEKFQTLKNIKNNGDDIAVYVKTQSGTKNYSGNESLVSMVIIDPVEFYREDSEFNQTNENALVHPTYSEPVYKDIFNFTYDDTHIDKISQEFNTDFRGCNIMISSDETSVNTINQLWIQKYKYDKSSETENDNKSISLSLLKNFSVLQSCFENEMFRTYTDQDNYTVTNGIDSGYEKNTFFGSRGIQLKTGTADNTITLTNWVDTIVDENNKKVRLNITESLINYITFSKGFKSNWTNFNSIESFNKTKYIKNSILNLIKIDSNCTFKLYIVEESSMFRFLDYGNNYIFKTMKNSSNNIICENGIYYIELDNLDNHIYSATLTIKL